MTADSTASNLVDAFTWTSLGEIVDDKQTYPNSAYTNLRIDSEQFSSIPKRAFRIRGVKVRIRCEEHLMQEHLLLICEPEELFTQVATFLMEQWVLLFLVLVPKYGAARPPHD